MKRKLTGRLLLVALALASMGTLNSCKDYDEDKYAEFRGDQATLQQALQEKINNLQSQIDTLSNCKCNVDEKLKNYVQKGDFDELVTNYTVTSNTLNSLINGLNEALQNVGAQNLAEAITNLDKATKDANAQILSVQELVKADGIRIDTLETKVAGMGEKLGEAYDLATRAYNQSRQDSSWIATWIANNEHKQDSVNTALKDSVNKALKEARENYAKANKYTDEAVANLKLDVDAKYSALEQAYKDADKLLQDSIDALGKLVAANTLAVEKNKNSIDQLRDFNTKLVTGILVNGTMNPVVGYAALPLDMRSNILAAYYGTAAKNVQFPSLVKTANYSDAGDWASADEPFSAKEIALLGLSDNDYYNAEANEVLFNEKEGNAGSMYLTVNPTSVSFDNAKFTLVNSVGKESKVKLSGLKKDNTTELNFGWTRAGENEGNGNGFYKANATLAKADINDVKVNIEPGLKSAMKDLIDRKDGINLTNIASTIYNQFNGIVTANAVKYTWTTKNEAGEPQTNSVFSQYGTAATAIKPLSYRFLQNTQLGNRIPTINPINQIDMNIHFDSITIDGKKEIDVTVKVDSVVLRDSVYTINGEKVTVTVADVYKDGKTLSTSVNLEDIYASINGSLNESLDKIKEQINAQVSDQFNGYVDRVNGYITRVNRWLNRIKNFLNNANDKLQPVMLYKAAKTGEFVQLSNTKKVPTVFEGTGAIALYPTSYTAELIAPAYKKYVAVVNVYRDNYTKSATEGDEVCVNALKAANNAGENVDMNKVIDGGQHIIGFQPTAGKGLVYEIAYSSVDYSGAIVLRRYFVKVK